MKAPAADRVRVVAWWRRPRLLVGLLLVAGSVVAGGRLMSTADDTVAVWVAARDLPAGATLAAGDVEPRRVRFADRRTASGYVSATDALPAVATLDRPVGAGELLPRAAVADQTTPELVEVPISVDADALPATVRQGSVVDVWVSPQLAEQPDGRVRAVAVLTDVVVVAVPRRADTLAPEATRQLIVGVPAADAADLGVALGRLADGHVVVARKQ